jgi:hypothetical protein
MERRRVGGCTTDKVMEQRRRDGRGAHGVNMWVAWGSTDRGVCVWSAPLGWARDQSVEHATGWSGGWLAGSGDGLLG